MTGSGSPDELRIIFINTQRREPVVSVLMKAYNHAPYIRQAIGSILDQSFQDFEIVVTDDASTDATPDIVREFTDPRVRLEVLTRNQGISGAMNATVARARGRYLAILNSDDWALPGRLRRQVDFLDARPDVSVLFGLPRIVDEPGAPAEAANHFNAPELLPDFSRRSWLRRFFFHGNCLCAPTAMLRREVYARTGNYDRRLTNLQDFEMWIRMLIAGHTLHVLAEELTAFRVRANNANMSAPRSDTLIRSRFEVGKILRHFAALDRPLFEEVFGDPGGGGSAVPVARQVAELALRVPAQEYQAFGLDVLYDIARDTDDFDRLRTLAGESDGMGARTIQELRQRLRDRDQSIAVLIEAIAARDRALDVLTRENASHAQEIAQARSEASAAAAEIEALRRMAAASRGQR